MPISLSSPVDRALEAALDRSAQTHRLIASNVANLDTPGYKARHLEFEAALAQAQGAGPVVELRRTDERHLGAAGGAAPADGVRLTVDETARRPDGNSVDPEREMADLGANGIRYAALTQALAGRLRALKAAIQEGK